MGAQVAVVAEGGVQPQRRPVTARAKVEVKEERRLCVAFPAEMTMGELRDRTNAIKNVPAHARVVREADQLVVTFSL